MKGFAAPLILISIGIILLSGSLWFLVSRNQAKKVTKAPTTQIFESSSSAVASDSAIFNPESTPSAEPNLESPYPGVHGTQKGIYYNNKYKFQFALDNLLFPYTKVFDPNFLSFLEGTGDLNSVRLSVEVYPNPQNTPLIDIVKLKNLKKNDQYGALVQEFLINDNEAVKISKYLTHQQMCNSDDLTEKERIFSLLIKGKGFVVIFYPSDSCDSLRRDWFETTMNSFKFY